MSKVKKGKCCPLIDGSREKRLVGLAKLAEVGVILVALFVLQEVRTNVIPWGCPLAQKQSCIRTHAPDASYLQGSCDDTRASCYDGGVYPVASNATDNGFPASYQNVFGFCQCLIYSQMKSGVPISGHCEFSNIFSILIFVIGAALVVVTELLLPRKVTAVIIFLACEVYFVVSLLIVLGLGWAGFCQGIKYEQITSIFSALIIGQCIFFLVAFGIMMSGAARLLPSFMILYDVENYTEAKRETNARRRSEYHLRKSGNTSLKSSGTIDLSRTSTGSNNTLTVPVPQINVPSSSMLDV